MQFEIVLFLVLFLPASSTLSCPVFTCSSLPANMCGQYVSATSYHINTNSCNDNYSCAAAELISWCQSSTTEQSYWCQPTPVVANVTWVSHGCPEQRRNKDFVSQAAVVKCSSSADCKLQDGTFATCDCVPQSSGYGVCHPDKNSAVFQGYWNECGSNHIIENQVTGNFWEMYMAYYTYTLSDLTCINVFSEIQELHSLLTSYQNISSYAPTISLFPSTGSSPSNSGLPATITYFACPAFSCNDALINNICGVRLSTSNFQVTSTGCSSGYACSAVSYLKWAQTASTGNYTCGASRSTGISPSTGWTEVPCYTKYQNKGFKSGQTLVTCSNKTDCELTDGTFTDCHCTFRADQLGVCEPDISNDKIFEGYWTACGADNVIKEENTYLYWMQFYSSWVYLQSDLTCGKVFAEAIMVAALADAVNGDSTLVFGAFTILGLLA